MTPADRAFVLAEVSERGYSGADTPEELCAVLASAFALDSDQRELLDLALYHAYWQGRADGGDSESEGR